MYKLLLCWRYLRTRYIALASIISVTLGVATMIVVNSVMAGFTSEMQNRIHGILSDVVVDSHNLEGMPDAEWQMKQIREVAGPWIEGMTPTVVVPGMLTFRFNGRYVNRQVQIVGIDPETQSQVSDFGKYLQHPENRRQMSFELRESGFDTRDHQAGPDAPERPEMAQAGWSHRKRWARYQQLMRRIDEELDPVAAPAAKPGAAPPSAAPADPATDPDGAPLPVAASDPFARRAKVNEFDPAKDQHPGIVIGFALASVRDHEGNDRFLMLPGDDVTLTLPTAGVPLKFIPDNFTVVDFYESKMSEYDASFVFVPIRKLQELRGMIDPRTNIGMVTSIQIKLKPGADAGMVRDKLREAFRSEICGVYTWRDKQGPLLAAVDMETTVLNVLLFLIIAVSGFGILAIFFMIVVEKTRDIGILKSLGASGRGIMGIFLSYGLSLGLVGSAAGMVMGLLLVRHINEIADLLGKLTGRPVFPPEIYYFYKIPTIVVPTTVAWIVGGAVAIAVLASILPAMRAALLHPVEALRYE